ncbi:MFS transporter [Candidatus Fermentibacteria bacterium]|nr:MAG: MFS transporter [Candidatus Fermentibacteria bacterium]
MEGSAAPVNSLCSVQRMEESLMQKLTSAEKAWCMYDWANSAFVTTIVAAVLPAYFAEVVCEADLVTISFFGFSITSSSQSLWGYAMSLAALLVAAGAPVFGAAADAGGRRKLFLGILTAVGVAASALLFASGPGRVLYTLAILVLGQLGFSGANVFYNSLLVSAAPSERRDLVSARGFAMGYLGGGLLLAINLLMVSKPSLTGIPEGDLGIRLTFLTVAVWWAVFSIPLFRKVPEGEKTAGISFSKSLKTAFKTLADTFRHLKQHRNPFRFLISFLLYNDGVQTIIMMATVFGKAELGLKTSDLIGALLLTQFIGVPGSVAYGRLAEKTGARRSILMGIAVYLAVVIYAWRMTEAWQFWIVAGVVGLLQGGIQAISRSFYSRLIPAEHSAEYFGFFSVSSRFASIIGPLMFALTGDLTGSTRNSILVISVLFAAGAIVLLSVRNSDNA